MKNMEIEKKYLVDGAELPDGYETYPYHDIEQAYLCTEPVVRIRKQDDEYYITYKSKGLMAREEYNLPLTEQGYYHLMSKADGIVITKRRVLIPFGKYTIELDIFEGEHRGLILAEVEFENEAEAESFVPPSWFGMDVTLDGKYHNSALSTEKRQ